MDNMEKMNRTKLKLSDLNPHLMCVLCGGYYIDATTIVECLHSFCRSCIVKHLESSKYCPICEVQVHKTKPLINIRPDKTLQDIVYKLVPGLFASEMRNRRKFYRERPHYMKPNDSESVGEVSDETKIYINDENITLSLDYHTSSKQGNLENCFREIATPVKSEKRYFKCPTGVTIYHLQKLLKAKYDLNDSNYKVEIFFKDQALHEDFTLLDISYIYLWKSKGTLDLTFKIYENVVKRQKIEETKEKVLLEEHKEADVRLEASNAESSSPRRREKEAKATNEEKVESQSVARAPEPKEATGAKSEPEESRGLEGKAGPPQQPAVAEKVEPETTVPTPVANEVELKEEEKEEEKKKANFPEGVKQNGVVGGEAKEVQLQISESGVMSISQIENGDVIRTVEESPAKMVENFRNNPSSSSNSNSSNGNGNGNNTNTGTVSGKVPKPSADVAKHERVTSRSIPEQSTKAVVAAPAAAAAGPGTGSATTATATATATAKPVKPYKTIRCSPKSWNPVIPKEKLRPTLMKNSDEPKKPLKFFKMRNMPRFLGNPASGVKPMFAESASENDAKVAAAAAVAVASERRSEKRKDNVKALKNILKIDPKTLRPIEKEEMPIISAPSTPNLLTNPFIPNNNHFLFSDPVLLHPNSGNYSNLGKSEKHNNNNNNNNNTTSNNNNNNSNNASTNSTGNNCSTANNGNSKNGSGSSTANAANSGGGSSSSSSSTNFTNSSNSGSGNGTGSSNGKPAGCLRPPIQNGSFPPICFPSPEYCSNFFPYQTNFPKHANFYSGSDKIDPLIRASRLSPFANLSGFNVAGFHASLPPSISLLLKHQPPHHHLKKSCQFPERKSHKDESTKETNRNCDENSLKVGAAKDDERGGVKVEEKAIVDGTAGEGKKESNVARVAATPAAASTMTTTTTMTTMTTTTITTTTTTTTTTTPTTPTITTTATTTTTTTTTITTSTTSTSTIATTTTINAALTTTPTTTTTTTTATATPATAITVVATTTPAPAPEPEPDKKRGSEERDKAAETGKMKEEETESGKEAEEEENRRESDGMNKDSNNDNKKSNAVECKKPEDNAKEEEEKGETGEKEEAKDESGKRKGEIEEERAKDAERKEAKESTCQDETSACNADAKPETVDNNNDNKSVNDKER